MPFFHKNCENERKKAGSEVDMNETICFCCSAAGYLHSLGTMCILIGIIRVILFFVSSDEKTAENWFSIGIESILLGIVILIVVCLESRVVFIVFGVCAVIVTVYTSIFAYKNRHIMKEAFEGKEAIPIFRVIMVILSIIVCLTCAYASLSLGCSCRDEGGVDDSETIEIKCKKSRSPELINLLEEAPDFSMIQRY